MPRAKTAPVLSSPAFPGAAFPGKRHDHGRCVKSALGEAEARCRAGGLRLTPLRKRVLELVWKSHKPAGAYDLLATLRRERPGAQPPTVYRALEFLQTAGLVHRIERLNAYVGCTCLQKDPQTHHAGQFLICRDCGVAAELTDPATMRSLGRALESGAKAAGFAIEDPLVEVEGLCPSCQKDTRP